MKQLVLIHDDMPNLTHIVTTSEALNDISPTSVLSVFGQQLKVIQFLDEWSFRSPFYHPIDFILLRCPKVDTLKYNVNYVRFRGANEMLRPSQSDIVLHKSLRNIIMQINPWKQDDEALLEQCLAQHFHGLTGVAFPALRRVVLEGIVVCDPPFELAYAVMRRRFPVQRIDGEDIVWEC
jgi:hypothetical protein